MAAATHAARDKSSNDPFGFADMCRRIALAAEWMSAPAVAIALNPSFVDWAFGLALLFAGQSQRAIDVLATYRRLDPFHSPIASGYAGLAHYMLKQYEQALPMLTDCVARSPKFRSSHLWLAATYARLGREAEAQSEVAEVLGREPNYTIAGTARRLNGFKHEKDGKHLVDGMRMSGVPA